MPNLNSIDLKLRQYDVQFCLNRFSYFRQFIDIKIYFQSYLTCRVVLVISKVRLAVDDLFTIEILSNENLKVLNIIFLETLLFL